RPQRTREKPMLNTFVVYVENKPGVLTRVASLFRRRAFNIDSLTVGRTEKPEVSRMTITVEADRDQARRIEANLYKLVNVLLVENITTAPAIVRDLAMIKVAATHEARSHVLELAGVFRARVVDVAPESLIIEITGGEDKIDGLLEVLRPYGVLEMVRTGIVAMRRGNKPSAALSSLEAPAQAVTDDDLSQSVQRKRVLFERNTHGKHVSRRRPGVYKIDAKTRNLAPRSRNGRLSRHSPTLGIQKPLDRIFFLPARSSTAIEPASSPVTGWSTKATPSPMGETRGSLIQPV